MCAAAQGSLRDAEFAKAVCNRLRFYSSSMGGKKRKSFSLSDNLLSSSAVKKLLLFLFELSLSLSIFLRSRFVFPSLSCPSGVTSFSPLGIPPSDVVVEFPSPDVWKRRDKNTTSKKKTKYIYFTRDDAILIPEL